MPTPRTTDAVDDDNDEATLAHRAACDFARAGKYAEALERHEWYHANALRIAPSQSGVRLSFAIGQWKELGDQYPLALASLKAIRDAGVRALEAGTYDPQTFLDVQAINGELGEDAATIELFKSLAAKQPALAKKWFVAIEDTLIDQGEIELFAEHGGDLVRHLKTHFITYRATRIMTKSLSAHDRIAERLENSAEDLVETTLKLVAFANKQGDTATATRLKALAFRRVPDPRIRP